MVTSTGQGVHQLTLSVDILLRWLKIEIVVVFPWLSLVTAIQGQFHSLSFIIFVAI